MITAQEAREKINTSTTKRGEEEKKIAEKKITEATDDNRNYCYLGFYAADSTVKWIKSFGYQVSRISDQKDGDDTRVQW